LERGTAVNAEKEVELLENSQVKLKVRIPGQDIKAEYDLLVKEYCAQARLPGFRRGKVPADVLIRKLGPALIEETRAQVLEKSISEVLEGVEHKPLPYGSPEVKADEPLSLDKDYSFEVLYDTYPKVELGPYTGIEFDEPAYEITDEDIGRELKSVQEQNALFTEKAAGIVETGNIVNMDYRELDGDGNERPGTKREAFVFEVGTGYNVYKIDDEITGMKKDETKLITKSYPAEFETKALAGKSITLEVKITGIKEKKLPEINDELAQDISEKFSGLEDLKADIRRKLEDSVKGALRSRALNAVMERVMESSTIPLPRSLAEYQLGLMWQDYLNQLQVDEKTLLSLLERQGKSVEDVRKDWMPGAEKRARLQLIITEIGKRENIAIEEEELEAEIARMAETRKVEAAELKESLAKQNLIDYMRSNLKVDKLYDFLLSKAVRRTGEKKKVLDILQGN
jgi:trigger factor